MALPDECPDPGRLEAWLSGTLPDDELGALLAHLDACASCRETIDRRLPSSEILGGLTPGAGDAARGHGPAFGAALASLKGETPAANLTTEHATAGDTTVPGPPRSGEDAHGPREGGEAVTRMLEGRPGLSRRIGPYEVIERVGRGGMGEVFRAMDPALDRVIAIKVLAPALADSPEARRRFLREARAAAAVCHEHVVTIHAVDESMDTPFLVMQFVAGKSLQEKIDRQAPLGLKEILRIGMQVASGLAAAHAQGLVHRDIKPANILLENGVERVKITDFGLARAASDPGMTRSGTIVGTPSYMSPEQARGEPLGPRSDLFSLGGVLYAMATGEPPFAADSAVAVLRSVCDDAPRPVRELNPEAPDWLAATIGRLMAKRPEARYATAEEVSELLRIRLAELQGSASPERKPSPPAGSSIRRRLAWVVGALASIVAAVAVIAALARSWPGGPARRAESGPVVRDPAESRPAARDLDPGGVRAAALVAQAATASRGGNPRAAIGDYSEALRLDPGSYAARLGRGRAYSRLDDWSSALADLDEAVRLAPEDAAAYEARAYARQRSGRFLDAIADCDAALRLDPGMTPAFAHRGAAFTGLGEWARGRAAFDEYIRRAPREPWSHYQRGICRMLLGDLDGALADFDMAIELDPNVPLFYGDRAQTLVRLGEPGQALPYIEKALLAAPDDRGLIRTRAWTRANLGDYEGSLADYRRAFEGRPKDVVMLADRASAAALAGHREEAAADFEEALRLEPSSGWVRTRRAWYLHAARGDYKEAIADCDETLRLNPAAAEARLNRGLALLAIGDYGRAVADLDRGLDPTQARLVTFLGPLSSRYPELHRARSEARRQLGDPDGALADLDEALRLAPDDSKALALRGRLLASRREFARAIADLDRIIDLGRGDAEVYAARGDARAGLGDEAGARADREQAARLRADHPGP